MWRRAGETEDEIIVELCGELNREDPGPHPVAPGQVRRTLDRFRREPWRGQALVLDLEGGIGGYALVTELWSNEMGGPVRVVDELYVAPHLRGRGHGSSLFAELERSSAGSSAPVAALGLEVRPANRRARALYERLGFSGASTVLYRRLARQGSGPEPAAASADHQLPRLYRDLADWFPLLTPPEDYAEEAARYLRLVTDACARPPRTLLDLGCGGGNNASHLKRQLGLTLVDLSPSMLEVSRRLNPECEHLVGDMRTVRLGRTFDAVLLHDAVCFMTTAEDLGRAIETAAVHCAVGGAVLLQPDYLRETFAAGTETGGVDRDGRGLRYLEWWHDPDPDDSTYVVDLAYLLRREDGSTEVVHDRHVLGLFPRATWLELIASAGLEPRLVPVASGPGPGAEVLLGVKSSPRAC